VEFLVVSKTKLKIILDKEDVDKYRLSDFSSSESKELRRRLKEIMTEAKERVGFDARGEKMLVSYYPTRLSGAELFVSVIGIEDMLGVEPIYYIFQTLGELSRACRAVLGTQCESSVYLLPSDEYCLELRCCSEGTPDVVCEFSEPVKKKQVVSLITKSKCLAKSGAVKIFASL